MNVRHALTCLIATLLCLRGGVICAGTVAVPTSELEAFLGFPHDTLSGAGNGPTVEGSAIQRTFSAEPGDALTFNYNFLTSESLPSGLNTVNDFAFVALVGGEVTVLADLFAGLDASTTTYANESGYRTWTVVLTQGGNYTLKIGVVDTVDFSADSALLIDNITIGGQLLDNLGFEDGTLTQYSSIGDARVVGAGFGVAPSEGGRQLLLTTVPEPMTLLLAALGGGILLIVRHSFGRSGLGKHNQPQSQRKLHRYASEEGTGSWHER